MLRSRALLRRLWLIAALVLGGAVGWRFGLSDNFATVRVGALYRSGQMGADGLASTLARHQIRTVLNLRGSHPESAWYRAERSATLAAGATQVDIPMSSCEWMSRAQARALLEVLDSAERPLLVHCFHGSERTGLVAAFAELLRPGSTLADADAQFSARYLYFGIGDRRRDSPSTRRLRGLAEGQPPRPCPRPVPSVGRGRLRARQAEPRAVGLRSVPPRRHHPARPSGRRPALTRVACVAAPDRG